VHAPQTIARFEFFWSGWQGDLVGPPPPVSYVPKPEKVREKLLAMLADIRDAQEWDEKRFGLNKVIFPQMANWLPDEGGGAFGEEFAAEVARLEDA
jgi:hypothetical protein